MANPQVLKVMGTKQTIAVLRQFEPDFATEFTRELREIGSEVQTRARNFVPFESPLSGWGPGGRTGWRSADIRAGIGASGSSWSPGWSSSSHPFLLMYSLMACWTRSVKVMRYLV